MHPFQYHEPQTLADAVALLTAEPEHDLRMTARIIAGGSDLLDEVKEGIIAPGRVVSLAGVPDLAGIAEFESENGGGNGNGLSIGAMTTIAAIAAHPVIRSAYTALAEAAGGLATPQIRNVGTLGGNLNQRPRCWYYRHPLIPCLKKGGDRCYALAGNTKYLCVTGGDRCYIVHPSDTAVALSVFEAAIECQGSNGSRTLPIGEFFAGPGADVTRETVLEPGEVVTRVTLPRPAALGAPSGSGVETPRSLYLKAREREAGDFALVSVAARLAVSDGVVRQAAVALGGVAPVPYRAQEVEEYLLGKPAATVDAVHAGSLAIPDARPMTDNGYKVVMANNLVKQAVARLLRV